MRLNSNFKILRGSAIELKIEALKNALAADLSCAEIDYRFEGMLHKFQLNTEIPHWLYVSKEFVADHTEHELVTSLSKWRIPEEFIGSKKSSRLFLSETGISNVDANFGKGK